MVHATIRMDISPAKATEALEILCSMAERTRVKSGCISSRIYRDVQAEHAHAIMIEELWRSQEELEQHLRSSDYHRVLLVVEMAKEPPEIRFNAISHSSGVETIEKARGPLPPHMETLTEEKDTAVSS
jgi:quinol monooxygenase YgiN